MQSSRTPPTRPALPPPTHATARWPALGRQPRRTTTLCPPCSAEIETVLDLGELAGTGAHDNARMALAHSLPHDAARLARVQARRRRDLAPAIGLMWSAGLGGALWALLLAAWGLA